VRIMLLVVALALFTGSVVQAQDVNPDITIEVTTLDIPNVNALSITPNGQYLLASDSAANQARLFATANMLSGAVEQVASADLYGTPTAVTATDRYGLVAVSGGDSGDLLQMLDFQSRARDITYSLLDVTSNPTFTAFAPGNRWGIAVGDDGYTVWEWLSADNVNLYQSEDRGIRGAAISGDTVYLLHSGGIDTLTLVESQPPGDGELSLDLDSSPVAISLTTDTGAVALDNNTLALLNLDTLDTITTFPVDDGPVSQMAFVTLPDDLWLAATLQGQNAVALFDVSDPAAVEPLGRIALDSTPQSMVAYRNLIFVSDGSGIMVIQASV
jgi:WD40 repeat protein